MAQTEQCLDRDIATYRQAAYAETTKSTYLSQLRCYLAFCNSYGYTPVPVLSLHLYRYVAYLGTRLKPSSIKQYLNVIRILHVENGYQSPLKDDWTLKTILSGIYRIKGLTVNRKFPITVQMLFQIKSVLCDTSSFDLTFWAPCLVAFYGMMRKSSLFPSEMSGVRLQLQHCIVHDWGLSLVMRYSKTVQYKERQTFVALPWNRNAILCPARTLLISVKMSGSYRPDHSLFSYKLGSRIHQMTYSLFTSKLKSVFGSLGISCHKYSGHSFRRGGATHAICSGLPAEIIKSQGDWKSLAYLGYIDVVNSKERARFISGMY